MIKTDLNINKGFKWYTENNISVKGFLFDSDQKYFEKEQLVGYFKNVKTKKKLLNKISNANGLFTVLIQNSDTNFILANDIIRAFPIFYYIDNTDVYLTDNIHIILKETNLNKLNSISKNEFLSAGFVSGHNTLINNVCVTQSGEILSLENNKLINESYYNYFTSETNTSDKEILEEKSKEVIDKTFNRLISSLNDRLAVIPLSGGFDSRLIACKLKELGHSNILCYTFGNSHNNQEKITSEEVAKQLGLDWIFIEYNQENIGKYINEQQFKEYYESYTQYSSSFMFQDYFAVKYLKENVLIPDDAVFIPGYSGDFLGGSQLYKNGGIKNKSSIKRIAKSIVKNRYTNSKLSGYNKNKIVIKIELQLKNAIKNNSNLLAYSTFENWEIKENLSKFIGHAAHIYDFWEYEYRLPFWDSELVDFFKYIPYEYKFGKILYNNVLKSYFKMHDVDFEKGINLSPNEFRFYKLKNRIKKILPNLITKRFSNQPDILNYELILTDIKNELKNDPNFCAKNLFSRNSYIAHWFIKQKK